MKSSVPRPPAIPLLALSSVLFGTMALVAKQATPHLPGSEIAFVRFLVGIVGVALVATKLPLRVTNWRGLFLRGLFGGGAVLCFFTAIEHLPVGLATLLNYTSPIFTVLWAAIFLGERIGVWAVCALGVTTFGVALVVKGDLAELALGPWVLVGILSSVLSGAAVATIREVRRTDGAWEIFASFCIVGALVTGVPAVRVWVWPDTRGWLEMIAVGVLALGGQILMTWSLRYLKAGIAGILMQLTPVCAMLLGWLVLGERTAGVALVGAAITVSGVVWGARLEAAQERAPG
jgi:drug/metabolite transporter (DMT)-like permease